MDTQVYRVVQAMVRGQETGLTGLLVALMSSNQNSIWNSIYFHAVATT